MQGLSGTYFDDDDIVQYWSMILPDNTTSFTFTGSYLENYINFVSNDDISMNVYIQNNFQTITDSNGNNLNGALITNPYSIVVIWNPSTFYPIYANFSIPTETIFDSVIKNSGYSSTIFDFTELVSNEQFIKFPPGDKI
jgi:hypothetical protein